MVDDAKEGMISILDEQCSRPNGSDAALLAHLDASLKKKDRYSSFQVSSLIHSYCCDWTYSFILLGLDLIAVMFFLIPSSLFSISKQYF